MSLANALIWWLLITGTGTLVVWRPLQRRGLVLIAVVNAVGSFIAYKVALPAGMNIRVDLLLTVPLVLIVLVAGIVHWSGRRSAQHAKDLGKNP